MPPLTLRIQDHRAFGSKPVVATAVVSDLTDYTVTTSISRWVGVFLNSPENLSNFHPEIFGNRIIL